MNIGYFTSFTAFLALNDADFCNNYLREVSKPEGILPLAGYLQFWGWFFAVATTVIALCKHETNFQPAGEYISIASHAVYVVFDVLLMMSFQHGCDCHHCCLHSDHADQVFAILTID